MGYKKNIIIDEEAEKRAYYCDLSMRLFPRIKKMMAAAETLIANKMISHTIYSISHRFTAIEDIKPGKMYIVENIIIDEFKFKGWLK